MYSVFKEVDFATSLLTGPFKDTNFANVFKDARNVSRKDFVKIVDFEPYDPSYDAPASFIASPIFEGKEKIGVLLFQIPIDEIDRVMTGNRNWEKEGLGKSGETYIVGSDHKMRSNSRFLIEEPIKYFAQLERVGTEKLVIDEMRKHSTSILFQEARTEAVEDALRGNAHTKIIKNYRGAPVLSSYTPLNLEDVQWVLLSEIDVEEAFLPVDALRNKVLLIALIIIGLVIIFGLWISRAVTKSTLLLIQGAEKFGKGDFSTRVQVSSKDEIGLLAQSFNQMAENLQRTTVSKNYVDNILTTMTDALIVVSPFRDDTSAGWPGAVITTVNQSTCDLLGYTEKELLGRAIAKIFSGEELLKRVWFEKLMRTGSISGVEKHWVSKNGREVPVLFSASLMCDREGNIQDIVFVAQDYTQRKRAEEALRNIATGVSAETGKKFFRSLVQYLAKVLDMDYAHIAELAPEDAKTVRTIAACHQGKIIENYEYSLTGTPCEGVIKKGFCNYPQGVSGMFPKDVMLKEMGAVRLSSYFFL